MGDTTTWWPSNQRHSTLMNSVRPASFHRTSSGLALGSCVPTSTTTMYLESLHTAATHTSHTHSSHRQNNKSNHNKPHRSALAVTCVARGGRMGHSSTTHPSSFVFKPWHLQASSMTTGDGDVSSAKAEGGIPAHAVAMSSSGRRFALMSYFGPPAGEAGELAADPPAPDPPAPDPPAPDADRGEVSFDTVMDIAASGMPRSSPAMNAKGMALGRRVVCSA